MTMLMMVVVMVFVMIIMIIAIIRTIIAIIMPKCDLLRRAVEMHLIWHTTIKLLSRGCSR